MKQPHWMSAGPDPPAEPEPGTAVIGTQMAAALANETQDRQVDRGPASLAGVSYDMGRGDTRMLHLAASPVDAIVGRLASNQVDKARAERRQAAGQPGPTPPSPSSTE